ncbi:hypothetical protein RHMOL_Rhmol03G0193200 [Rhododendron molle]|uniref:Uncharacterized protein n=1 Tax=Rhododendron molle TaxID=49168 RepID=A0ACC0PHT5_RHOML|nr:hypothetical protein RHMOL_Rhmol03G0193200 [Rhododendron molle]
MAHYRRIEIIEPSQPSLFIKQTSIFTPTFFPHCFPFQHDHLDFALDLLRPTAKPALIDFHDFDTITDLIQIDRTPHHTSTRRLVHHRVGSESYLQSLCDRVSALELSFDKLLDAEKPHHCGDRKYTWTAEVNDKHGLDRKYKWTAEIKGGEKKKEKKEKEKKDSIKGGGVEKKYRWSAEIKDKRQESPVSRRYVFEVSTGDGSEGSESEKKEKEKDKKVKKKECGNGGGPRARVVEIEEPSDNHGAFVLRQAFAKRGQGAEKWKGKRKELSPQDAAMMIQVSFRAYLIRRSQALRALRELAVAKAKLKELRALFNNFSYRRRLSHDAEERQRFSEKIIVLLLTVDAIEGADHMVRAAKRSIIDELEAMLDVVDPQPSGGKSLSMRRRTFDMPDGVIQKELAAGVAEVVHMLDQENGTFEACL